MEIVKKNLISIICGVIALVAVVALFFPVGGWYTDFAAKLKERADVNNKITAVLRKPREMPVLAQDGKSEPLKIFPNKNVIAAGNQAMNKVHAASEQLLQTAVKTNREGHDVLVNGALPKPSGTEPYAFRDQYKAVMTPGLVPNPRVGNDPKTAPENIPDGILQSAAPPTEVEIIQARNALWNKEYEQQVVETKKPNGTGPPVIVESNRKEIEAKFLIHEKHFDQNFRTARATKYKIYMDPDALTLLARMDPMAGGAAVGAAAAPPSPEEMWYAQMGVWVQQDIARAIREMNRNIDPTTKQEQTGIQRSPIKHLISIDMPVGFDMYRTINNPLGGMPAAPAAGAMSPAPAEGDIPKMFGVSITGRVCNSTYDVVHSSVTVVADERAVDTFLQMLQSKRLMTVLEVDTVKVNNAAARELGYDYGNAPVVKVTVKLEHLFMRGWTAHGPGAPMPQEVKQLLGVQPNAQDQGGGGGTVTTPVAFR